MSVKNKKIGHYFVESRIGHGAFSNIYLGRHDILETKVAIKFLSVQKIESDPTYKKCLNEIDALRKLHHPNVVQLFEVLQASKYIYLILEYCSNKDMYALLDSRGKLPEGEARFYFRQIIRALIYCHQQGIAHRDLKLENIFLGSHQNVKVGDFGLSKDFQQGELMTTSCGSLRYAAPEVIQEKSYTGELADVWSCGIILFTLLAGYHPFDDDCYVSILKKIMRRQYIMPEGLSDNAVDLIKRILEVTLPDGM